jgi:hypothetical protein
MKTENEGNADSVHPDWERRRFAEIRQMTTQQQFDLAFGIFLGTRQSLDAMWADMLPRLAGPQRIASVLHALAFAPIRPRLRVVGDSSRFFPLEGMDLLCIDMSKTGYLHARALLPLLGFLRVSEHDPHKHATTSYVTAPNVNMDGLERFRPLMLHHFCTKLVLIAPAADRAEVESLLAEMWPELSRAPRPEWSEAAVDEHVKKINVVY